MKPAILLAALFALCAVILAIAECLVNDPDREHHLPHPDGNMLVVHFAHADHAEQTCISCHHNFVDDTGAGLCFDCHKSDPEVSGLIEEQFHDLCRSCHVEKNELGEEHGPTRDCDDCHVRDNKP